MRGRLLSDRSTTESDHELAAAISAGFIGLELYEGADPDGAAQALHALQHLGVLVEVVDELGPIARRALRAKMRRRQTQPSTNSRRAAKPVSRA